MSSRLGGSALYSQTYVTNANATVVRGNTLRPSTLVTNSFAAQYGFALGNGSTPVTLFSMSPGEVGILSVSQSNFTNGGFGGIYIYSYFNNTGIITTLAQKPGGSTGVIASVSGSNVQFVNNTLSMLWRRTRIN